MPLVDCRCGQVVSVADEDAGRTIACPRCGQGVDAPFAAQPVWKFVPQADPAFDRDVFLLRQKHFALSEKYVVWDERAQPILYIERPAHFFRSLLAVFAALVAAVVTSTALGLLAATMPSDALVVIVGILAALGGGGALVAVLIGLSPKRHVTFYRDQRKSERLLEVLQDRKWVLFVATYTVNDAAGNLLARLHKNYLYNVVRKQWMCYDAKGSLLCIVQEDDLMLALMRRFVGPLLGLLRTNFILLGPDWRQFGQFNRNFTILDRYALDVRGDPERRFDRRVALAIGVMLDTGEKR